MEPDREPTILIVDDHEDAGESLAILLNCHDFRAKAVTSGERVFEDGVEAPDIVIIDPMMHWEDGWALIPRFQATVKSPEVVVLTGSARRKDWKRAKEAGAKRYLLKPVDIQLLIPIIREILSDQRSPLGVFAPS